MIWPDAPRSRIAPSSCSSRAGLSLVGAKTTRTFNYRVGCIVFQGIARS